MSPCSTGKPKQKKEEEESRILHSPYDFKFNHKKETIVEHVLAQAGKSCGQGWGDVKFVENSVTGEFYRTCDIEPFSRRIGSSFKRRGMNKGDTILYSTHECSIFIFALGVWRAGGVMRAIYPEENAETMTMRLVDAKAKWFLVDPETVEEAKKAVEQVPWAVEIIISDRSVLSREHENLISLQDFLDDDGQVCPELSDVICKDDPALILSTSGTTGPSKGCVYTQLGVLKIAETMGSFVTGSKKNRDNGQNLKTLVVLRPTHVSGISMGLHLMTIPRVQNVVMRQVSKDYIFQAVHKYKPVIVCGFPTYLLHLANDPDASKYDTSSIKYVLTGATIIQPSFVNAMQEKLRAEVVIAYGMTEAAIFTSSRNLNNANAEDQANWEGLPNWSVGKLWPGVSLKVRDSETGRILGPNQRGELCFRTDARVEGYWKRPKDTAQTFIHGFIHTGDVGYYDEEGFVFVVNRSKECFRYYSNHIIPSEVEQVILRHPSVHSVSVVGVPDPEGGDSIPRAFVTLKKGAEKVSAKEIRQFANESLASYKRLRGGLFILPELPLGKTGKVDTATLKSIQVLGLANPEE